MLKIKGAPETPNYKQVFMTPRTACKVLKEDSNEDERESQALCDVLVE